MEEAVAPIKKKKIVREKWRKFLGTFLQTKKKGEKGENKIKKGGQRKIL